MLSWFDKKDGDRAADTSNAAPAREGQGERGGVDDAAQWAQRLRDAQGDDTALLLVAQSAPGLSVKIAAVEALNSEAGLKLAERAFRDHDRKVHSLAKRRLEQAVAQRESRARAEVLIETASAMATAESLPVNHLANLDRDWQVLAEDLLEPGQQARFTELRSRLAMQVRGHAEQLQQVQRWIADAKAALAQLQLSLGQAAAQGTASDVDAPAAAAHALLLTRPDTPACAALGLALQTRSALAAAVKARLAWLDAATMPADAAPLDSTGADDVPEADGQATTGAPADELALAQVDAVAVDDAPADPAATTDDEPDGVVEPNVEPAIEPIADAVVDAAIEAVEATDEAAAPDTSADPAWIGGTIEVMAAPATSSAQDAWNALPAPADNELSRLLELRFDAWRHAQARAVTAYAAVQAAAAASALRRPARATPEERAAQADKLRKLDARLGQADAALAEGHPDDLQRHLQAIDAALQSLAGVSAADKQRARRHALHAEFVRLKSWQKWGGGRARDDLLAAAENLARATATASDAATPNAPRLRLKEHADAIASLRQRWKQLDHLGAAASPAMWQRFDAALTLAHEPVAAQQTALKAARQENLAAREALLAALEAVPSPEDASSDALAALRKQQLTALDQFRLSWRKLGPLEHTVPGRARARLEQRLQASVARIEAPLLEARRSAEADRVRLIDRAQALVPEVGRGLPMREIVQRVRDLQAQWQQQARALPLARAAESALWARFKAATDAVFAQRAQAESARDAEIATHVAAAEALVSRLTSLGSETPAAEITRTLAEVDRAWREGTPLPRAAAEAVDARYRAARTAAQQLIADSTHRRWREQCDALAARLALCEQRESGSADDELQARWAACAAVPPAWDKALAERWKCDPALAGPLAVAALDELLLQLETALALPSSPEHEAARRQLKLLAMKDALEGRKVADSGPARRGTWLASAMRQVGATPVQRDRLRSLIAALRRGTPELLGMVSPRG